ncbi:MAG: hypothetical protein GY854_02975 [Deltaproteobacteria bacterium]|nr:hypothetical protein [Deltaproteobacteria bacterium]
MVGSITIEGVFRNGRVELREKPDSADGKRVLVTFLSDPVDEIAETDDHDWPADFFQRYAGAFRDAPLERGDQGEFEEREPLR